MLGRDELEGLTVTSALGGRMTRGFEMAGFLSRNDLVALLAGAVRTTVIAGGAAGDHAVAGIAIGDALRSVLSLAMGDHAVHAHDLIVLAGGGGAPAEAFGASGAGAVDLESVTGQTIVGGDPLTGGVQDLAAAQAHAWAVADLTAEFAITGAGIINNGGGTNTTGRALVVVYEDLTP